MNRLDSEVKRMKELVPQAHYIGLADGAKKNGEFLNQRTDTHILDFWHASEYISTASDALFPDKEKLIEKRSGWKIPVMT